MIHESCGEYELQKNILWWPHYNFSVFECNKIVANKVCNSDKIKSLQPATVYKTARQFDNAA